MPRTRFWFILLVFIGNDCAIGNILYVPDDFIAPQQALDESLAGDTIIMRNGSYDGPLIIPNHHLTIGSEYILVPDDFYITNCIVRPALAAPNERCFDTAPATGVSVQLSMIGMTIQEARALGADGGGVRIRNRNARIRDCVFKSCGAAYGGAIYADSCVLLINRTSISGCDVQVQGRCLYTRESKITVVGGEFRSSSTIYQSNGDNAEIAIRNSTLGMFGCNVRDMGYSSEGRTTFLLPVQGQVCDSVFLYDCLVEENQWSKFVAGATPGGIRNFILDSCLFQNNAIAFGLLDSQNPDAMRYASITRNQFVSNERPGPNFNGVGFFAFTDSGVTVIIEENFFSFNDGGAFSCVYVNGQRNPLTFRVHRNYFTGNSNFGFSAPPGGAVFTTNLGEGIVEYNVFQDNIGHAFDTWEFGTVGYAMHNFWGDSTGPFVAEEHPQGLGDTTDTDTIYDEWLESEDDIPDTSIVPNAVDDRRWPVPSTWFISNVYPNPFNSEFRVELDGMTGPDFEIRMFDLLGREVALLHSGRTLRGALSFDAPRGLAAGVYFLRAKDHLYSDTKKVLYLK